MHVVGKELPEGHEGRKWLPPTVGGLVTITGRERSRRPAASDRVGSPGSVVASATTAPLRPKLLRRQSLAVRYQFAFRDTRAALLSCGVPTRLMVRFCGPCNANSRRRNSEYGSTANEGRQVRHFMGSRRNFRILVTRHPMGHATKIPRSLSGNQRASTAIAPKRRRGRLADSQPDPQLNGDAVLDIQVGLGETNRRYRVLAQRIREWRDLKTLDPNSETHTESVRELL